MLGLNFPPDEKPHNIEIWASLMQKHIKMALREGMTPFHCYSTLRDKLQASKWLEPKIIGWENANPKETRTWQALLGIVHEHLRHWREDNLRKEKSQSLKASYMRVTGAKPAAAVQAADQRNTAMPVQMPPGGWRAVLEKHVNVCRNHVLFNSCSRGANCPRIHEPLSAKSQAELREALA